MAPTPTERVRRPKVYEGAPQYGPTAYGVERFVEVTLTSAELLALRATPKTLAPAPAAGYKNVLHRAELILKATATGYVESTANLAIKYKDGSGVQVSDTIESTGFIDQTVDTTTNARCKLDAIAAKTACDAQPLVLHNLGAGEFTTGTGTMKVKLWHSVVSTA